MTELLPLPLRIHPLPGNSHDHARSLDLGHSENNVNRLPEAGVTWPQTPKFQNYLRACYTFEPTTTDSPTSVTLSLNEGDIILIHSIHFNGWADGTLLQTGDRGWLPTNYCEGYDNAPMQPLLRALLEFWDIVKCGSETNLSVFQNQDYIRGVVAGTRYLLEKSSCLTREAALVKQFDRLRRSRKILLAELAVLVKEAKQLQRILTDPQLATDLSATFDGLLLQAFKIVIRAVKFLDVREYVAPMTASSQPGSRSTTRPSSRQPSITGSTTSKADTVYTSSRPNTLLRRATGASESGVLHPVRTSSIGIPWRGRASLVDSLISPGFTDPQTPTPRHSFYGKKLVDENISLASTSLDRAHDSFLAVLSNFLGSHVQSRNSTELLLSTERAVEACRQLLDVVEAITDRDNENTGDLLAARDQLCRSLTTMVDIAGQVFRPLHLEHNEIVYLPEQEESTRLTQTAAECVRFAGDCVQDARAVLETIGDFEVPSTQANSLAPTETNRIQSHTQSSRKQSINGLCISGTTSQLANSNATSHISDSLSLLTPPLVSTMGDSPVSSSSIPPTPDEEKPLSHIRLPSLQRSITSPAELLTLHETYGIVDEKSRHSTLAHRSFTHTVSVSNDSQRTSDQSRSSPTSTRVTSYRDTNLTPPRKTSAERYSPSQDGDGEDSEVVETGILDHTYSHQLMFNAEGQLIGGTLDALVERLTAHDTTPDPFFVSTFYLTFRLFATPQALAEALIHRFDYVNGRAQLAEPVRLRVYNIMKGWIENHWRHDCDEPVLPLLNTFAEETLSRTIPSAGKRLLELTAKVAETHAPIVPRVVSAVGRTHASSIAYTAPKAPVPNAVISKSQLMALRTWRMGGSPVGILDFDALELARQITLKTSQSFCCVLPEELLASEWTKKESSLAVNLRVMSALSTDLSNLVADTILQFEEPKKRAAIIKQWIKIATKCLELSNYDSMWAIFAMIDSTMIKRMRRTWELVPAKSKAAFDELSKLTTGGKNNSEYRKRILGASPPGIPWLPRALGDLTFVDHGNPNTRKLTTNEGKISVINMYKHVQTAKVISDLQRFQVPYNLTEIPELQTWLQDQLVRVRSAGEKNFQNHYRRSILLEPKDSERLAHAAEHPPKEKFDFLGWAHLTRERPAISPS